MCIKSQCIWHHECEVREEDFSAQSEVGDDVEGEEVVSTSTCVLLIRSNAVDKFFFQT